MPKAGCRNKDNFLFNDVIFSSVVGIVHVGAAVVEWLSSWLAEQGVGGLNLGLVKL